MRLESLSALFVIIPPVSNTASNQENIEAPKESTAIPICLLLSLKFTSLGKVFKGFTQEQLYSDKGPFPGTIQGSAELPCVGRR